MVSFAVTPAFATAGTYTATATILTADTNTANDTVTSTFTIFAPITGGTVNVGTGEAYTSLTNAGGIFAAINAGTVTGNITVNITTNLTGETGAIALNQVAAPNTVTIKPSGGARTISGTTTGSLIRFDGADNVTIDGSLTGGTDKSLTITNNGAGVTVFLINAATGNTVRNTVLQTAAGTTVAISTVTSGTTGNNTNTIQNNDIGGTATTSAFNAVLLSGTATAKNTGNLITGNRIFNFSQAGIFDAANNAGNTYSRNEIFELTTQTGTALIGFTVQATSVDGFTFTQNYIHDLNTTGAAAGVTGILLFDTSTVATSLVANNMVALSPTTTTTSVRGILDNTATGEKYNLYYNSVYVGGTTTGTGTSEAYYRAQTSTTDFRDNILVNARTTSGTGKQYAIRLVSATAVFTSNYNDIYNTPASATNIFGQIGTTDYADLTAFRTASNTDANSISSDPLFVSTSNLHVQAGSPVIGAGTPIASVTVDFDNDPRPAANPDIGADQFVAATMLVAPNCTGIAPSPLVAGSTNKALLCFSLSSNTNASFTALNVPFTTDPSVKFTNPRLISSTDADYTTTGDNTLVATGTVDTTQFSFSGFTAFSDQGTGASPSLTATPLNFFIVADVLPTVDTQTPATQPSVAPVNVIVSNGIVSGATATGQNYTFVLAPTAATAEVGGRVVDANGRGLSRVSVTLAGGSTRQVTVLTNGFGYYNFPEVPVGETYVMTVASKIYTFNEPTVVFTVNENLTNVNFIGYR